MAKILIVADLDSSRQLVDILKQERHLIETDGRIESALGSLNRSQFDVIILRRDFSTIPTESICRDFRSACPSSAILMLADLPNLDDLECALDSGADDYLVCSDDPRELRARVRALARRYSYAGVSMAASTLTNQSASICN
jgi:DNA-binding response OmpR family regulator